jgi:hypothetical protein
MLVHMICLVNWALDDWLSSWFSQIQKTACYVTICMICTEKAIFRDKADQL